MESIIQVKNISKKYNINQQRGGYVALRDVLANVIKKPFSYAKHKAMEITGKAGREEFWALKDINFSVEKGEALGIIGANGAGKSTLLKILTQITPPTTGEITMEGKVASLLEVGTGFHPELTGRENIFLNGAILGMRKEEIEKKFDEIVEFSGIGKFIDTPVKHYSSGMYVRLAFSVAAHLEPDILLIDEVLAVGDANFQKKCLGKMDEETKKSGRTILFVSHNMTAIQNLCERCILLKNGKIDMIGKTNEVVKTYLNQNIDGENTGIYIHNQKNDLLKNNVVQLISAKLTNNLNNIRTKFNVDENIFINIEYLIKNEISHFIIDIVLRNEQGVNVIHSIDSDNNKNLKNLKKHGTYSVQCKIPCNLLNEGKYFISIGGRIPNVKQFFAARNSLAFCINSTSITTRRDSIIYPNLEWEIIKK